ncbi:MAG: serine/threonine-protein phosphatase [Planctomycetota bacterium]|nr:MAG: serine/threonine-protein phosphatase [Planctomycetota bacterium]REK24679.1 MAG: serine/threonine-protein phosphatase [Planctomycetota bacterium]REK40178.1 MAG: serine/threonine-protein phosphatase [Planctomycetota bacterium]
MTEMTSVPCDLTTVATNIEATVPEEVKCMEVWGGCGAVSQGFSRPGLDVWIWSRPQGDSAAAGGELHLLSSCASGRITRMLVADVCAHGSVFAELAGSLRDMMLRNLNQIRQTRFVESMSRSLHDFAPKGGFSTALIATYFAPRRTFSLCNTGHPPALHYRQSDRSWTLLKQAPADTVGRKSFAADVTSEAEYQQFEFHLETGDMVIGYSNTLAECRDADGNYLGVDGVLDRVRRLDATAPDELATRLVDSIRDERTENLQAEDATILVCQATDKRVPWKDNLMAPLRLLTGATDKTRLT